MLLSMTVQNENMKRHTICFDFESSGLCDDRSEAREETLAALVREIIVCARVAVAVRHFNAARLAAPRRQKKHGRR
jgi:hypothetical protein